MKRGHLVMLPSEYDSPHLDLAVRCAEWIDSHSHTMEHGISWPADPLETSSFLPDLYYGAAGIVVFLAELYCATEDSRWLARAEAGVDHLSAWATANGGTAELGLYTGLSGIAFATAIVGRVSGEERHMEAARRTLHTLRVRARTSSLQTRWNDAFDVVFGTAGIGLYLLDAYREYGDDSLLDLACQAGQDLIAAAVPMRRGAMWYPSESQRIDLPNFSHGTAGVSYFLASLYETTGKRVFLENALRGAEYLASIAKSQGGCSSIHHSSVVGIDYYGWCHGPVGTARLAFLLARCTGDVVWIEWLAKLTETLIVSGIPERRMGGFWDNVSQCCGNAGLGQFLLDLNAVRRDKAVRALLERVVSDTVARATIDERGARWVQAEHRAAPNVRRAQTGFMQGAAGVGTFFLRLHLEETGKRYSVTFPDSPFEALQERNLSATPVAP